MNQSCHHQNMQKYDCLYSHQRGGPLVLAGEGPGLVAAHLLLLPPLGTQQLLETLRLGQRARLTPGPAVSELVSLGTGGAGRALVSKFGGGEARGGGLAHHLVTRHRAHGAGRVHGGVRGRPGLHVPGAAPGRRDLRRGLPGCV